MNQVFCRIVKVWIWNFEGEFGTMAVCQDNKEGPHMNRSVNKIKPILLLFIAVVCFYGFGMVSHAEASNYKDSETAQKILDEWDNLGEVTFDDGEITVDDFSDLYDYLL